MDPFVGEIRAIGFNYAPRGWMFCNGQLLQIRNYTALFSLLGVQFGGDGKSTFGLPDLQGRALVHWGSGPGLASYTIGQADGSLTHALTVAEMPSHSHSLNASNANATAGEGFGNLLGRAAARAGRYFAPNTPVVTLGVNTVGTNSGVGAPHENRQPYLALNFIIAIQGVFPPRQ